MPKINLQQFCGDAESSIYPPDPFLWHGWQYATNGRICVRVPTKKQNGPNDIWGKRAAGLPWRWCKSPYRWKPWTAIGEPQSYTVRLVVGYEVGTVVIHDCVFDMIATLPGVEWRPTKTAYLLALRFKGGEGFVMSLNAKPKGD